MSRLARHLNVGTLWALPEDSSVPATLEGRMEAMRELGIEALQADDAGLLRGFGSPATYLHEARTPDAVREVARTGAEAGALSTTVHLGTGFETEEEADALCRAVLDAQEETGQPLSVETHRATLTQDPWRTLRLVERFGGLRFTADLSHWYTGAEMPYGDWEAKLDRLQPVFDRVAYVHGRIGSCGSIQVALTGPDDDRDFVRHHREMLTRCFAGCKARGGDVLPFAPELLPDEGPLPGGGVAAPRYARVFEGREESDRWVQALILYEIADACWAAA